MLYICYILLFRIYLLPKNDFWFQKKQLFMIYLEKNKSKLHRSSPYSHLCTAWKVSVFGVFLVRIFSNSDQKNFEYRHFSSSITFPKSFQFTRPLYLILHFHSICITAKNNKSMKRNAQFSVNHLIYSTWFGHY